MFGGVWPSPQARPGRSLHEIRPGTRQLSARQLSAFCAAFLMSLHVATAASAADRIRIAAQKTGTLAWELDIVKAHGLDKKADLDIQVVELAKYTEIVLLPEMNIKTAMKLFDDAEAEVLAVLESVDSRKVIGFLTESFARRRYVEEIDKATRGVLREWPPIL